ncbi:hypothetical protein [Halorussus pelagicus]|uniref:hypothetical protein n=1 Tax=Halorussus pelagicus TaxID=2505977 RepID=UPI000FFBE8FE|nr:hypothetical protein [Halorussus pelagicus]
MLVEYIVGDALDELRSMDAESASVVHLDDAWARPMRNGAFGVKYDTHAFSEDDDHFEDHDTGLTTAALVGEIHRVLRPGSLLVADTDDWLLGRLLDYISSEWGERQYALGQVTALSSDSTPDCSTPGMYLSTGGYTMVLAWKAACPVRQSPLNVPCQRQRDNWGWSSAKSLAPYRAVLETFDLPSNEVVVPCAGTAPMAVAAELICNKYEVVCIDVAEDAGEAYERRRTDELNGQRSLGLY